MGSLLKQVNQLLRQANLPGQFPLLVGYYHSELKNLILVSAGLNATLNTGEHQIQISNGVPLGTLGNTYLNQLSQRCDPGNVRFGGWWPSAFNVVCGMSNRNVLADSFTSF
jgi:two-component system response regulator